MWKESEHYYKTYRQLNLKVYHLSLSINKTSFHLNQNIKIRFLITIILVFIMLMENNKPIVNIYQVCHLLFLHISIFQKKISADWYNGAVIINSPQWKKNDKFSNSKSEITSEAIKIKTNK